MYLVLGSASWKSSLLHVPVEEKLEQTLFPRKAGFQIQPEHLTACFGADRNSACQEASGKWVSIPAGGRSSLDAGGFSSLVVKRSDGISVRGATSTVLPASDVKAATRLSQPLVPDPLKKVEPLNIGNSRAGDCFAFYIAYYTNINALK